jgi:hypothetical protein
MIRAPPSHAASASARLPAKRASTGRPVSCASIDLRDNPASIGTASEAETRVDHQSILRDARCPSGPQPLGEKITHLRNDIDVVGSPLHRAWLALHVHQTNRRAARGHRLECSGLAQCIDIVDQVHAERETCANHLRLAGIEGNASPSLEQGAQDGLDPPPLLVG